MEKSETINRIKILDQELEKFRIPAQPPMPAEGWVKHIRESLNMPTSFIAKKLGKSTQAITEYEKCEARGAITIETLRKIGDAMNMDLVYGFVPRKESIYAKILRKVRSQAYDSLKDIDRKDQKSVLSRYNNVLLVQQMIQNLPKSFWEKYGDTI